MAKTEKMTLLNQKIQQKINGKRGKNNVPYRDLIAAEQGKILPLIMSRCVCQLVEACSSEHALIRVRLCKESVFALGTALAETSAEVDVREMKETHLAMLSMLAEIDTVS